MGSSRLAHALRGIHQRAAKLHPAAAALVPRDPDLELELPIKLTQKNQLDMKIQGGRRARTSGADDAGGGRRGCHAWFNMKSARQQGEGLGPA